MRLDYDLDADALYIKLSDGDVARTEPIDDETYVDVDAAGTALGIEVITPRRTWPLEAILRRYDLGADVDQLRALFPVRGDDDGRIETPRMSVIPPTLAPC